MPLTPRQARFVSEYLKDLNATQAAIRAGYAKRGSRVTGCRLLANPNIKKAVEEGQREALRRNQLTADRLLEELRRIATVDLSQAFDERGRLKPLRDMPEDVRRAIVGMDTVHAPGGDGEVLEVRKIKVADKVRAIELGMRHFGMLNDKLEVSSGDLGDRLAKARARLAQRKGGS